MQRFLIYRRDPFVISILSFFILACAVSLLYGAKPGTVSALMPGWYWYLWVSTTLAASVAYMYGIFTRNLLRGVFLVRSLCPILGVSLSAIGAAQLAIAGSKAIVSGFLILSLAVAFLYQRRLLTKIIQDLPQKGG